MLPIIRTAIILTFITLPLVSVVAQSIFLGSANQIDDYCVELTPDANNQSGWAYNVDKFDLTQRDSLSGKIFLGDKDGADGMVFMLHNDPRGYDAEGCVGEAMGFGDHPFGPNSTECGNGTRYAISPSIGFEFDTYRNSGQGDPANDHIAYLENGNINHGSSYVDMGELEDNTERDFLFIWDPTYDSLMLYIDNVLIYGFTRDIRNDIFSGAQDAYIGFTASTGGASNQHYFCADPDEDPITVANYWTRQSGNFNDPNTWLTVPGVNDCAVVAPNHALTLTQGESVGGLTITSTGSLDLNGNNLNISSCDFIVNGSLNNDDGTITMDGSSSQNFTVNVNTTINNLTIDNAAGVSIGGAARLNIAGTLDMERSTTLNTNNKITLQSTASRTGRIDRLYNDETINGDITVERYIYSEYDTWRYLCSPVQNATVLDWHYEIPMNGDFTIPDPNAPVSTDNFTTLYNWSESDQGWSAYPQGGASADQYVLQPGVGYIVVYRSSYSSLGNVVDVTGTINRGTIDIPISYTNTGDPEDVGWNLVGNPYPSAIDWESISNNRKRSLGDAIYLTAVDPSTEIYQTSTFVSGVGNPAGTVGIIESSQAFSVKATASNARLRLRESDKTSTAGPFYRAASIPNLLRMSLKNAKSEEVQAVIRFTEEAQAKFDTTYDALQRDKGTFRLSSISSEGDKLSINSLKATGHFDTIPLEVKGKVGEDMTLQFFDYETFMENYDLYLFDSENYYLHDITHGDYNFTLTEYSDARFSIIRVNSFDDVITSLEDEDESINGIAHLYPNPVSNGTLQVSLQNMSFSGNLNLTAIDVNGVPQFSRTVSSFEGNGDRIKGLLDVSSLSTGIYWLHIQDSGNSIVKKFVVE